MQIEWGSQSTGDSSTTDAEESVVHMEPASFFVDLFCVESLLEEHVLKNEINKKTSERKLQAAGCIKCLFDFETWDNSQCFS